MKYRVGVEWKEYEEVEVEADSEEEAGDKAVDTIITGGNVEVISVEEIDDDA